VLTLCDAALDQSRDADVFWINATKVEALLGLGQTAEAEALKNAMVQQTPPPAQWMVDSMNAQLMALTVLKP
jgi:hypothetical protein